MGTIGGADNFCLQKSRMPLGRIGIFYIITFHLSVWVSLDQKSDLGISDISESIVDFEFKSASAVVYTISNSVFSKSTCKFNMSCVSLYMLHGLYVIFFHAAFGNHSKSSIFPRKNETGDHLS